LFDSEEKEKCAARRKNNEALVIMDLGKLILGDRW